MKIIDVNDLPPDATIAADICVVGAGAAGLTVAGELDGGPETVCVVEGGGLGPDEETQALYDLDVAGHPVRANFMSRARYFGGTCNLWAGRCMMLTPIDLAPREWIPHSGWPIAYAELQRYYPRAAAVLRLPSCETFARAANTSRLSAFEQRFFDTADLQPAVAVWGKKPLRFSTAYRRRLQRSRNVSVYVHANVTDIRLDEAGRRVESCAVQSIAGRRITLRARRFVLACGGLETARLLLASRSVQSRGIGNDFDLVGRFYMDHPRAVFGTVKFSTPQRLPAMLGWPLTTGMTQIGVGFAEATQRRDRLLNSYLSFERYWSDQTAQVYQSFVHSMKILLRRGYAGRRLSLSRGDLAAVPELIYLLAPRELMPHALYSAARRVKQRLSPGVRELIVVNFGEQMPNPESRVYLGDARDRLGVPRLVLDWRIRPEETGALRRLHAAVDARLRAIGAGRLESHDEALSDEIYTDASHHIGTARMSASAREGVVDPQCAVHGVGNLFIAGSAVFPTSGHANPTLTIVALALRLADHLKRTR